MTNRLSAEALDALLAEHVGTRQDGCLTCDGEWPCTFYLLASEVRDARPVIDWAKHIGRYSSGPSINAMNEALAHYEEGSTQ